MRKHAARPDELDWLAVDSNAQLLPGFADGPENLEMVGKMVTDLASRGVRKIVFTVTVSKEQPYSLATIERAYGHMCKKMLSEQIRIEVMIAGLYRVDKGFTAILNRGELMPLPGSHVLLDMSLLAEPAFIKNVLFQLWANDFIPVLVHPERYSYYHSDLKKYKQLKEMGCLFQLNLLSLADFYGTDAKQMAKELLKLGMIDLVGSALHTDAQMGAFMDFLDDPEATYLLNGYPLNNAKVFGEE